MCDRSAREFIACIKEHSSYFEYGKCTQEEFINSMCFLEVNFCEGTDQSFKGSLVLFMAQGSYRTHCAMQVTIKDF